MRDPQALSLSRHRLMKARQCLETAQLNAVADDLASSVNRSYYAIFHGMRAVLALERLDFKKHSAVIAKFRELYIKTGLFDKAFSPVIGNAFDLRGSSDYDDFFLLSKQEALDQIADAQQFLAAIEAYIQTQSQEPET